MLFFMKRTTYLSSEQKNVRYSNMELSDVFALVIKFDKLISLNRHLFISFISFFDDNLILEEIFNILN